MIPEGLSVSSGRGMYEEKHTRTRETLSVPDSKVGMKHPFPLEEGKVLGDPAEAKSRR